MISTIMKIIAVALLFPSLSYAQDIAGVSTYSKADALIESMSLSGCVMSHSSNVKSCAVINDVILLEGAKYIATKDGSFERINDNIVAADALVVSVDVVRLDTGMLAVAGSVEDGAGSWKTVFLLEQKRRN